MLKAVAAGAGGYALAQFTLATSAFAAGGGTADPQGVVVSGRHLSFMAASRYNYLPSNSMAVTAQLVSRTGSLPTALRAFVVIATDKGDYGRRFEADIQHLVGQYAIPGGPIGSQFYAKADLVGLHPATRITTATD